MPYLYIIIILLFMLFCYKKFNNYINITKTKRNFIKQRDVNNFFNIKQ